VLVDMVGAVHQQAQYFSQLGYVLNEESAINKRAAKLSHAIKVGHVVTDFLG
jgi:hypothetical protein